MRADQTPASTHRTTHEQEEFQLCFLLDEFYFFSSSSGGKESEIQPAVGPQNHCMFGSLCQKIQGEVFSLFVDEQIGTMKVEVFGKSEPNVSTILPFDENYSYYEALEMNNAEKVTLILYEATGGKRKALLDGQFQFTEGSTAPQTHLSRLSRPLLIATMMGSGEVMEILIKEGADVHQQNCYRENIVHSLVAANSLDFITDDEAVEVFHTLVNVVNTTEMRELLFHENADGFRPVEMAANFGSINLYETIHLTPDVYVTKTIVTGSFKEEWIDITEYETYEPGNRRLWSPLNAFAFLEKHGTFTKTHGDIVKCTTVNLWMEKKYRSIRVPLVVSIVFAMFAIFSYVVIVTNGMALGHELKDNLSKISNTTICSTSSQMNTHNYLYFKLPFVPSLALVVFMFIYYTLMALLELKYIFGQSKEDKRRERLFLRSLSGKKDLIVTHRFYQYFDIFTNIAIPLSLILILLNHPELKTFTNFLAAFTCLTSIWCFLFFFQMSPLLGHFTTVMQRIVWVLFQFFILYVTAFLPYVHGFYRLIQESDGCFSFTFSSAVVEHYYHTFLVSLNMIDFTQFKEETTTYNFYALLFFHVCYVFTMVILLLNFLIALLSISVAEIMEHKDVIMLVQKIKIISSFELLQVKLSRCSALWRYLQRNNFHLENGRYYLKRVSMNRRKLFR